MPRHFTVNEAQKLLPAVERAIRGALVVKAEFDEAEAALEGMTRRILMLGGAQVDREVVLRHRGRRDTSAARLKEAIEKIQSYGCLVKDLDIGLVDFLTLYKGEEVYLCWRLGEESIEFWHGIHEGYQGRKKIDREFLDSNRGDRPS